MLATTAFGLHPDVLSAVMRSNSLTVATAAASPYRLAVGLAVVLTYRRFRGKAAAAAGGGLLTTKSRPA